MTQIPNTLFVNGKEIEIADERNLLEIIRKAGIEIPTFCYHSELSVYGACRLCLVDIEGRGIQASCSTPPQAGMKILTHTSEIRSMRKMTIELLLANHPQECPTCSKSASCKLKDIARKLGVDNIRFKQTQEKKPIDVSSPSLIRDPNKCILCGDCVRACAEIQGIGAIDFAHRGSQSSVLPAFGKDLALGECVNCGQCAAVCPTGALVPKPEIDDVWKSIYNPNKKVVAQIAPAVRVAIGEHFGMAAGTLSTGQMVAALKAIGFDQVYDTGFAADLTVIEEAGEFLKRKQEGKNLPQFTSCCPAWVKYTEQYYPSLLQNLSSCRSPQQMFGSIAREILPEQLKTADEDIIIVSIMPCTAKKFEARRPEFSKGGKRDVDHVITTQELALMIEEAGIDFCNLDAVAFDMPLGFKTGAGIIFGNTGGVSEAVLRYAADKLDSKTTLCEIKEVRGEDGIREASLNINGTELKLAIVHGLANAKKIADEVEKGKSSYDLIEVMACPMGCIGGAGQPIAKNSETKRDRIKGLYNADRTMQLHKSQENHLVAECYKKYLGEVGGEKAHNLLHTHYQNRRRMNDTSLQLAGSSDSPVKVTVCVGTSCFVRGSQDLLKELIKKAEKGSLSGKIEISASFCFEKCNKGPTVHVGNRVIEKCTISMAEEAIAEELKLLELV